MYYLALHLVQTFTQAEDSLTINLVITAMVINVIHCKSVNDIFLFTIIN